MTARVQLAGEIRALLVRHARIYAALRTGVPRPGGNREAFRRHGPLESWALDTLEGQIEGKVDAMRALRGREEYRGAARPTVGPQGVLDL